MEEEIGQEEETVKEHKKQNYDWLKQYQFQKGQSGNPNGAPKGKRLKTFALELLEKMNDEDKAKFLKTLDSKTIWEMAEGKAKQETELRGELTISQVLDNLENGPKASEQEVETE